jgi:hypothetical protein
MSEQLDPQALEALRRDRQTPAPEDARGRVAARLGFSSQPPELPTRRAAVGRAAAARVHLGGLLAVAFVAGGMAGALLHARLARIPATRVVYLERPDPSISSAAFAAPSPTTPAPNAADSALAPAPVREAVVASSPHTGLSPLDAERALLDAARVSLVSGDTDSALRALDQHARLFIHPILGEERDALFVQSLVRAGRYDEARTRAEAFRRKAPQSLLLPAVEAALASIP